MNFHPSLNEEFETAEFGDARNVVAMTGANILNEINDVNTEFDMRKKLYETKEYFQNIDMDDCRDDEIVALEETVITGQRMLKDEIANYLALRDRVETNQNSYSIFHEHTCKIKNSLLFLKELSASMEVNESYTETITKSIETSMENAAKLDADYKKWMDDHSKDLQEKYNKSTQKVLQLRKIYQVLTRTDICYTCPICSTNPVEMFLMPCGHCFCSSCIDKTEDICFMCRREISRKGKLFFLGN